MFTISLTNYCMLIRYLISTGYLSVIHYLVHFFLTTLSWYHRVSVFCLISLIQTDFYDFNFLLYTNKWAQFQFFNFHPQIICQGRHSLSSVQTSAKPKLGPPQALLVYWTCLPGAIPLFPSIRSPIIGNGFRNIIVTTPCLDIFNPIRISPFFECQLALGFGLELVWDNFPGICFSCSFPLPSISRRSGFTKSFYNRRKHPDIQNRRIYQKSRFAKSHRSPEIQGLQIYQESMVFKSTRNLGSSNLSEI